MLVKNIIKVKNGEVPVAKFGTGEKFFVILPGLSLDSVIDSAEAIESAYSLFEKEFTVYLIDRNLYPKAGYKVGDVAEDTAEVMRKIGIDKAYVFGASLGGMVAQELAIKYPESVYKLVLGSSLSRPNGTFLKVLTRWANLARKGDITALVSDMNANIYSPETLDRYKEFFASLKVNATKENVFRFIVYAESAKAFDVYSALDKIRAETFVISSGEDKITTAQGARETADKLRCGYFEYKKFGHAVFDEAPDYKSRIYDFFNK